MKNINIDISTIDYSKPISYYSNIYNLSVNAIRNRFKKLGIYNNFIYTKENILVVKSKINKNIYDNCPNKCKNCLSVLSYKKRKNQYCSLRCSAIFTQKNEKHGRWSEKYIQNLRDKAKENPYFNGTRKSYYPNKPKTKKYLKCEECKKTFECNKNEQICCSRKCFSEWNKRTGHLKGKTGGIREGAGRGKSGWYKGYFCNSSYELAWVIYSLEHNIKFIRNKEWFNYTNSNGKISKYFPDFYLTDADTYVEIKGYKEKEFDNKQKAFTKNILIVDKEEIKPYIEYVESKYGKSFIKLYDGNPHKINIDT
jgi:hypothetical protein